VDWQGNGFMDLAEVRRLGGRSADELEALVQASDAVRREG